MNYEEIRKSSGQAARELLKVASVRPGDIFIVGCSTSEIAGCHIGRGSNIETARAVYDGIVPVLKEYGLHIAAQCCEHLNRAVILDRSALPANAEICNVVPQLHAGGAFAMTVYERLGDPVAVEHIRAAVGMDIGDTLIGMHLRDVAVPVRLSLKEIGGGHLVCARTRPKFIGGSRAVYDDRLSGGEVRK